MAYLLANAIQSFKISSSRRSVGRRRLGGESSPLWQKRYYDRNTRDYAEFVKKLRHIHRNPVKSGLVERAEDWKWSSFRHYATAEECGVEIESEWTARKRERSGKAPHLASERAMMMDSSRSGQMWATRPARLFFPP